MTDEPHAERGQPDGWPRKSGGPDSNRRRPAWKASILPLNYPRAGLLTLPRRGDRVNRQSSRGRAIRLSRPPFRARARARARARTGFGQPPRTSASTILGRTEQPWSFGVRIRTVWGRGETREHPQPASNCDSVAPPGVPPGREKSPARRFQGLCPWLPSVVPPARERRCARGRPGGTKGGSQGQSPWIEGSTVQPALEGRKGVLESDAGSATRVRPLTPRGAHAPSRS